MVVEAKSTFVDRNANVGPLEKTLPPFAQYEPATMADFVCGFQEPRGGSKESMCYMPIAVMTTLRQITRLHAGSKPVFQLLCPRRVPLAGARLL